MTGAVVLDLLRELMQLAPALTHTHLV